MENEPRFEGEEMRLPTGATARTENPAHTETKGIFIVVLGLALIVILAALFMWYKASLEVTTPGIVPTRPTLETNKEPETTTATAQTESFGAMSTSDEISAIEADLESTNLDTLESELTQIDTELEASAQ
jgi:hypothetical protein